MMSRTSRLPSVETLMCMLQESRLRQKPDYAREVHAEICSHGLENHVVLGNHIVPMLVDCADVTAAQQVFRLLAYPNEHSWTSLILGCAEDGHLQHAVYLYRRMCEDRVSPSKYTFEALLKTCASSKDAKTGQQVHSEMIQKGLEKDLGTGSTLVDMYFKCGLLVDAQAVFDELPFYDVVSWTVLIAGYAEHGAAEEAVKCCESMQAKGCSPNMYTFACLLKACSTTESFDKGQSIYREVVERGYERDLCTGSALVDMFIKCGALLEAREVFDKLPVQDVVLWTTLLAGYTEHGLFDEAIIWYDKMKLKGFSPDKFTYACALKACSSTKAMDKGREIHQDAIHEGFEIDSVVGSTLLSMYATCGSLSECQDIFMDLPARDVITWNALIAGYIELGLIQEAMYFFHVMQLESISPDAFTLAHVIKLCGSSGKLDNSYYLHREVVQRGFEREVFVQTGLVGLYAKCGSLDEAQNVFDQLTIHDTVSWTSLIAGYAEHGPAEGALICFEKMQEQGNSVDGPTLACVIKACGALGHVHKGQELHIDIFQKGLENDVFIGTSLVYMYAKCGCPSEAQLGFDKLPVQDVVSWNALISGFSSNHDGNMAIKCFEDMQRHGVRPDEVTFTCLFTTCSHANLVVKGQEFFKLMVQDFDISPTLDHYICMIDLLARTGYLCEAQKFLESMPRSPCLEVWTALLNACKTYGEAELGFRCFKQLVQMDAELATSYILMGDIYASAGRLHDVHGMEDLRNLAGAMKKPASAMIEANQYMHEFMVGNLPCEEISAILENVGLHLKEGGHIPNLDVVF